MKKKYLLDYSPQTNESKGFSRMAKTLANVINNKAQDLFEEETATTEQSENNFSIEYQSNREQSHKVLSPSEQRLLYVLVEKCNPLIENNSNLINKDLPGLISGQVRLENWGNLKLPSFVIDCKEETKSMYGRTKYSATDVNRLKADVISLAGTRARVSFSYNGKVYEYSEPLLSYRILTVTDEKSNRLLEDKISITPGAAFWLQVSSNFAKLPLNFAPLCNKYLNSKELTYTILNMLITKKDICIYRANCAIQEAEKNKRELSEQEKEELLTIQLSPADILESLNNQSTYRKRKNRFLSDINEAVDGLKGIKLITRCDFQTSEKTGKTMLKFVINENFINEANSLAAELNSSFKIEAKSS